jgi:hypothetical protein
MSRAIRVVVLATSLLIGAQAASADVIENSGTTTSVPGYPGVRVEYRVGAVRTTDREAHFWLKLKQRGSSVAVDLIVCAMLDLKGVPNVPDDDFWIAKNDDGDWECRPRTPEPGDGPPSVHFGCEKVSLPANGDPVDAFDTYATFGQDFTAAQLGKAYFDILKDCPIVGCAQTVGTNKFLAPEPPYDHSDWSNTWTGAGSYVDLAGSGLSETDWPSGNWVTMRTSSTYPVYMQGLLTGAPPGAAVALSMAGQAASKPYIVRPAEGEDPCAGRPLEIFEEFLLDGQAGALLTLLAPWVARRRRWKS